MEKGSLSVQTENIFPVIKRWLYSDKDIFIREAVSNAADAITKLRRLVSLAQTEVGDDNFRIDVTLNRDAKTITIADNGIGMTEEQCRKILEKQRSDSGGIGVKNVNDRLRIYFGSRYGLTIHSELDVGTTVTVRIPKLSQEEQPHG